MSVSEIVTPIRPAIALQDVLKLLEAELGRIKFGSIDLAIHDGKVVQFDITEKRRLT
ncbi:MAG: DUF2292 domain-containing protein [Allosphingosinicella sp.]